MRVRELQPLEPGLSALPSAVEHQPGGMAEAVRLAVGEGVVAQPARAAALRMPMINSRFMA